MKTIEEIVLILGRALSKNDLAELDSIDLYSLEDEWKKQHGLYRYWSEKLAIAKTLVNLIEDKMKYRKASVDKDVRSYPSRYGLDKATNEAINNVIILDSEYKKWAEMLIEAKYYSDVLFGIIITLEHRRDSLKNEVKLFLNNYYAEPSNVRERVKTVSEREERMNDDRDTRDHIDKLGQNSRLIERRDKAKKKLRR
jgi:hypothetical protein